MKYKLYLVSVLLLSLTSSMAFSQLNWLPLNGPYGGSPNNILKGKGDDIFAITSSSAYKSTNQGQQWNQIKINAFTPIDFLFYNNLIFAVAQVDQSHPSPIYISNDNMQTWTEKGSGLENISTRRLIFKDNILYACTDSGVYKSTNMGDNWSKIFYISALQLNMIFNVAFNSKGQVFIATVAGLYKTIDSGKTYQLMNPSNSKMIDNIENIIIDDKDNIFLNTPMGGMFNSTDDGKTWNQIGEGIISSNLGFILKKDYTTLIIGKRWGGMFISNDVGETWKQLNDINSNNLIITNDGKYLACNVDGVFFADSLNGSWNIRNQGICETIITSLYINKDPANKDEIIAGNTSGIIQKSTNNGNSWKDVFQFEGSDVTTILKNKNDILFASSIWGGVARSTDGGDSWTNVNVGLDGDPDIRGLAIDKDGNLYAMAFSEVYKSVNNGDSWTVSFHQNTACDGSSIAINSKNMIFAATKLYGIVKSINGGATWSQMTNGMASPVFYLAINKYNDDIYAVTNQGDLYRSTNDAASWQLVSSGVGIISFFFISGNEMLAGVDQNHQFVGVMHSKDKGSTWESEKNGIEDKYAYCFDFNLQGEIYTGTNTSIYKTSQKVVSVEDKDVPVSDIMIYPNPADDYIKISIGNDKLALSEPTIKIIDFMGNNVLTLPVNDNNIFDIKSLSSGIYYIKIGNRINKFIKI